MDDPFAPFLDPEDFARAGEIAGKLHEAAELHMQTHGDGPIPPHVLALQEDLRQEQRRLQELAFVRSRTQTAD